MLMQCSAVQCSAVLYAKTHGLGFQLEGVVHALLQHADMLHSGQHSAQLRKNCGVN